MMEREMFATFTDWELSDIDAMPAIGMAMWPKVQAADAISFKATSTGANTARTIIVWPDAATAQTAIDGLRAKTIAIFDTKAKATTSGEVLLDLS